MPSGEFIGVKQLTATTVISTAGPDTSRTMKPQILAFFEYSQLPPPLQTVSKPCRELAEKMAAELDGPELEAGLRKLLEAKDCFVRAAVTRGLW